MSGVSVTIAPPRAPLVPARPMGWPGPRGYVPTRAARRAGTSRWAAGGVLLALVLAGGGAVATVAAAPAVPAAPPKLPSIACAPAKAVAKLSDEQRQNATTIIAVGAAMGVPERGRVAAVATALQESVLRNLHYGDRDSQGLFQQRPSQGWGTVAQVTDPTYSSRTFYRHLVAVPNWEAMPVTKAAQTVQRSAYPGAYAKWEPIASALVDNTSCERTA